MLKKGDVIKGTDFINFLNRTGDRLTGELEFASNRTKVTGFDGANNHILRYSADDSDKLMIINRKGVNDYEFFVFAGGGQRKVLHEGNSVPFRLNNGVLEYWDGGAWKSVGTDFSRLVPKVTYAIIQSGSPGNYSGTALDISGRGYLINIALMFLSQPSGDAKLEIIVDQVSLFNGSQQFLYSDADGQFGMTFNSIHRFNNSLVIKVNNTPAYTRVLINYLLD